MFANRDIFLALDDAGLSAKCVITFTKGSGPGGQKRNKTSSAVKVELPELGVSAADCTERSQFRNRANALRKLRLALACQYRILPAVPPENMQCSMTSEAYPLWVAKVLDVLEAANGDCRTAAATCGITFSALLKKLYRDPQLWQHIQRRRQETGLPALPRP